MNLLSSKSLLLNVVFFLFVSVGLSSVVKADAPTQPTLEFFYDSQLRPMTGLSCASEDQCKARCGGSESCQKPVPFCLNCIGTVSPYLNDFFNNVGDMTTSCFNEGFLAGQAETLFKAVSMVPVMAISPYNPLGLKDLGLVLKFMTLCPAGTGEPMAIALIDPYTHTISDVPLVKCGASIFPLVRVNEDCAGKASQIADFIKTAVDQQNLRDAAYQSSIQLSDKLPISYDLVRFSEYTEAQYVHCSEDANGFCDHLCNSSVSCSLPIHSETNAKAIAAFNRINWIARTSDRLSPELLESYLKDSDADAFSYESLGQAYDLPQDTGGFSDFSVINSILSNFAGIFVKRSVENDGTFFVSTVYRDQLRARMSGLCDGAADPIILGHSGSIERAYCRIGTDGFFRVLAPLSGGTLR